jgi:demethylmenaquinone methyltransferase/2-methoxy-6-polyprenyl-1,4-benzoquinol methylase
MLQAGRFKVSSNVGGPVAGDALDLPLADDSVVGVAVAFGIRNVVDLSACCREIHRVLAPGGRFVVLEFSTPTIPVLSTLYHAYFRRILPTIGRLISGHPTAYRYLPESVAHFPEGAELAQRLREAGFSNVRWHRLTLGVAALHVALKAQSP